MYCDFFWYSIYIKSYVVRPSVRYIFSHGKSRLWLQSWNRKLTKINYHITVYFPIYDISDIFYSNIFWYSLVYYILIVRYILIYSYLQIWCHCLYHAATRNWLTVTHMQLAYTSPATRSEMLILLGGHEYDTIHVILQADMPRLGRYLKPPTNIRP